MKRMHFIILFSAFILFYAGSGLGGQEISSLEVLGGPGWGGNVIRDNPIDTVTGATKTGGHAGMRIEANVFNHFLESGIEYGYYSYDIVYNDTNKSVKGTRTFSLHSITVPFLYNFRFFIRESGNPFFVIGAGIFGSYIPYRDIKQAEGLPGYTFNNLAGGMSLKLSLYPFEFGEKFLPGIYVNFYRSLNKIYQEADYLTGPSDGDLAVINLGFSLKYRL